MTTILNVRNSMEYKLADGTPEDLRSIAHPVGEGEDVTDLIKGMFNIMSVWGGIGLAANQVGVLKRVITIKAAGFKKAIINPEIVKSFGGQITAKEGCLSFPGLEVLKVRSRKVIVTGFDSDWKPVKFKLKGLAARVAQHEIDHLDGIIIQG
jgi:peptide deformylase